MDKIDQWLLSRHGRFTGSLLHKIIQPKPANSKSESLFSTGGITYIEQIAVERMTVLDENPKMEFVKSLMWGKAQEAESFDTYRNLTRNFGVKYCGTNEPVFLEYNDYSGASPDGIDCSDDGEVVNMVLELKNPLSSAIHFSYLRMKDQYDLEKASLEYYTQVQFLLMITKAPLCHWVSYDGRFKDKSKRMKIIEVLPDKKFHDNAEIRLMMAEKEVQRIISELS